MRYINYIIFIFSIIILYSCATIIKGSNQKITITSNPPGAEVFIDEIDKGQTPLVVKLPRNSSHIVRIEKENCHVFKTGIARNFNGWIFGNIIFAGIPGLIIDAVSGASNTLSPEFINAILEPNVVINRADTIAIKNLVKSNFTFDVSKLDSIPVLIGDKKELFNLFQKSAKNPFTIEFIVNKDGIIESPGFYSDDKYILRIQEQISKSFKFIPGKMILYDVTYNVNSKVRFTFNQTKTVKIEGTSASIYSEKIIKNNETVYKKYGYPKTGYSSSEIDSIINVELLLKNESAGVYSFNLSKYDTYGVINMQGFVGPYYQMQREIIKFNFRKIEY